MESLGYESPNGTSWTCEKGKRTNIDGFAKTKLSPIGLDDIIPIIDDKMDPRLA
jgi:hypothetical protein